MKTLFREIPHLCADGIELRRIVSDDAPALQELINWEEAYRYLPTFLYERKYDDIYYTIEHLYDECLEKSLILGIFYEGEFCGISEVYSYRPAIKKVSVGCRLLPRFWGRDIATKELGLIVDYLFNETDIKVITASVMANNKHSAASLEANGFHRALGAVPEYWGYAKPIKTEEWVRRK